AIDAKISEAERERATCLAEKRALELRGGSRERRRVLSFYIGELRRDLDALTKERVRLLIELGTEAAR
ncbi:MAG TPA: hypothetical protein VFR23_25120, partial [Jiangellaceae bacterium]|nr:hypothetical protein [Jiangellaceae bacterium]